MKNYMKIYWPPSGTYYDDVKIKMAKPLVQNLVILLRKNFNIPENGFGSYGEAIDFLQKLRELTREKFKELDKIGKTSFRNLKKEENKNKLQDSLIKILPRYRFENLVDEIIQKAKIRKFLYDYALFVILCSENVSPFYNLLPDPFVFPKFNFPENSYKITLLNLKEINEGISVRIYAPLRKKEWNNLKRDVNKIFKSDFQDLKPRPYPQKKVVEKLKIAKSNTIHEAYDLIDGENKIVEDKKKLEVIKKMRQRIKKQIGT